MAYTFFCNTQFEFGTGKVEALKDLPLPGSKALIVTTKDGFAAKFGHLARVQELLEAAGKQSVVYDKVEENPRDWNVDEAAAFGRENEVDLVVGLGGGSSMDAACATAAMITNDGVAWDYIQQGSGGGKTLANPSIPHIQITTTAGTGSESDLIGVIQKDSTAEKVCFFNEFAKVAIIDPDLTKTVPADYTAYQGFDALFHNAEGYLCNVHCELGDTIELQSVRDVAKYLPIAIKDPENTEARTKMSLAASMGGWAMALGGGMSQHSLEHAMSGFHPNVQHGAGLIMLSRAYFGHFIDIHADDQRFIDLAIALGKEDATKASDFLTVYEQLMETCGVADVKMSDYGFTPDEFPALIEMARRVMFPLFFQDPVELTDEDCIKILEKAYC